MTTRTIEERIQAKMEQLHDDMVEYLQEQYQKDFADRAAHVGGFGTVVREAVLAGMMLHSEYDEWYREEVEDDD
jgi:hypothetical protein